MILKKILHKADVFYSIFSGAAPSAITYLAIPFLITLYPPEDFTEFYVATSLVMILSNISTLGYMSSIVFNKQKTNYSALALTALIVSSLTMAVFVLIAILMDFIGVVNEYSPYGTILLVYLFTIFSILCQTIAAKKEYSKLFLVKVASALSIVAMQFLYVHYDFNGLIWGYMFGLAVSIWIAFVFSGVGFNNLSSSRFYYNIKSRINFLKYQFPSSTLHIANNNLLIPILAVFYGGVDVGVFAIAVKLILTPFTIIGAGVGQWYITGLKDNNVQQIKERTQSILFALSVLATLCLIFVALALEVEYFAGYQGVEFYFAILIWALTDMVDSSIRPFIMLNKHAIVLRITSIGLLLRYSLLMAGILIGDLVVSVWLFVVATVCVNIYSVYKKFRVISVVM